MSIKGNDARYGSVAIALHWVSALAIVGMFTLGFMAAASAADPARQAMLLRAHIPLGVTTVLLTLIRLGWLLVDRRPARPVGMASWQAMAERVVHIGFYVLIILLGMSGTGLMFQSGAAEPVFFGSPQLMPDFRAYAPMIVHGTAAFALLGLFVLHTLAALYHQFVRRDHLLHRMGVGA